MASDKAKKPVEMATRIILAWATDVWRCGPFRLDLMDVDRDLGHLQPGWGTGRLKSEGLATTYWVPI
jgi:hypothetical protein